MTSDNLHETLDGAMPTSAPHLAGFDSTPSLSPKSALALYAGSGRLDSVLYADGYEPLERVLALSHGLEPATVAKLAVYSRERGRKETPALLLALLSARDLKLFAQALERQKEIFFFFFKALCFCNFGIESLHSFLPFFSA